MQSSVTLSQMESGEKAAQADWGGKAARAGLPGEDLQLKLILEQPLMQLIDGVRLTSQEAEKER